MKSSRLACLSALAALVATVSGQDLYHERSLAGAKIDDVVLQKMTRQKDPRIVGGQPADPGEYPYYAHVANDMLCGGTLIHPDIVLTAAHCFGTWFGDAIMGSTEIRGQDGAEQVPIESENPHPDFDNVTFENDIMIIKLENPSTAPVITLNTDPDLPPDGLTTTVIGFGTTTDGGDVSSELLEVDVQTFDFDTCEDNLAVPLFPDTQICAGDLDGGRDSCQGDSGMMVAATMIRTSIDYEFQASG